MAATLEHDSPRLHLCQAIYVYMSLQFVYNVMELNPAIRVHVRTEHVAQVQPKREQGQHLSFGNALPTCKLVHNSEVQCMHACNIPFPSLCNDPWNHVCMSEVMNLHR